MAFRTTPAPYVRSKKSTEQIMWMLGGALLIVWLAAVITSFVKTGAAYGVKAILMLVVALATTAVCDVCTSLCRFQKGGKVTLKEKTLTDLRYNYSYITAIIFTLTLPVWVSYYVVIIGSIFATVVVKNFFGGFGKNIFNPAAMARIFVALCFASSFSVPAGTTVGVDAATGATLTTAMNNTYGWVSTSGFEGFTMMDCLLGNYFGAMGETFTLLILALGVALSVLEVINWRTPAFYIGTVALSAIVMALFAGENPWSYMLYHISLGGLVFGAVFMLTDPVTCPTSPFGKSLVGVIAGLITVLVRIKGGYPEGVVYSIAFCNLISPAIDYLTTGKSNYKLVVKYSVVCGLIAVSVLLNGAIAGVTKKANDFKVNAALAEEKIGYVLEEGQSFKEVEENKLYEIYDGGKLSVVVYKVNSPFVAYTDEGHELEGNVIAYVGFDTNKKLSYLFVKSAYADESMYTSPARSYAMKNFVGKSMEEIEAIDIKFGSGIGATYSTLAIRDDIKAAYAKYCEAYAK